MLSRDLLRAIWRVADDPPRNAREIARLCLLDWLGVAIAGAHEPVVDHLVMDAEITGGSGDHPLIGRSERVSLRDAVLISGAAGHALDFDDGLVAMMGHPSAAIIPALLPLALARNFTGVRLLDAMIAGVEAAGRIGALVSPEHYRRGFHATGTIGAIAAAVGCSRLLGLSEDRMVTALGLATTRAAGLKISFGTDAKPLHAGWAALVGLTAACWAERGMSGAEDVLPAFAAAMGSFDPNRAAGAAPEGAHILNMGFKRYAACAGTHSTIDATRRLVSKYALDPNEIVSVIIRIDRHADAICNIAMPRSGLEAKFSLRTVAAMALLGIDIAAPESFSDAGVLRRDLFALRERARVELQTDWPSTACEVEIEMRGAIRYIERADAADRPADLAELTQELRGKFLALVSPVLCAAAAVHLAREINNIGTSHALGALILETQPKPAEHL